MLCVADCCSELERDVFALIIPPPPLCRSACERLRQLFDLMCFPDDLSVFTPRSLQSAKDRKTSQTPTELCFEFLAFLLLFLHCSLLTFSLHVILFGRSKTILCFILSLSCLFLLACVSLASCCQLPVHQSSEPDEGSGPAGSGVPWSAPGGGRVPHGAQVQEGPCSEAQDPSPGTVPAAASGRPLPH